MTAGGPTSPIESSSPPPLSTAPAFAMNRRGSTPVTLWPKRRPGSRRHSILIFRFINQSDLWNFNGQECCLKNKITDVTMADIDRGIASAEEVAPEHQVSFDTFVAVELYPTRRLRGSRKGGQRRNRVRAGKHVKRLEPDAPHGT